MTSTQIIAAPAPGESWKGLRQLERDYGLKHGQIAYWIKKRLLAPTAIQEPTGRGHTRLIDEAAIRDLVIQEYQPHHPLVSRPVILPSAIPGGPSQTIEPQVIDPKQSLTHNVPLQLPDGFLSTAELVETYLSLRQLEVDNGHLALRTWTLDAQYLRPWAAHAPVFPWSQHDVDTYVIAHKGSYHAKRYVKSFTLWANKRYPQANLPMDIRPGVQIPPRPEVLTPAQEDAVFAALKDYALDLWVYAMTLTRTGCRAFELLDRDWDDLTPQGFFTQGRAKKKPGHVYFAPGVYDLINTLPEPHTGPIFKDSLGHRADSRQFHQRFNIAIHNAGVVLPGPIGSYTFRHLFAERMKNHMTLERLAHIMRTSVEMLERSYGKHPDDSYLPIVRDAVAAVWGDTSQPTQLEKSGE